MVSDFCKELRKIGIDNGEILKDMEDKLKVAFSCFSAIENGKRAVPEIFVRDIPLIYGFSESRQDDLKRAYDNNLKTISFDLDGKKFAKRELALKFVRSFEDMSDAKTEELFGFIDGEWCMGYMAASLSRARIRDLAVIRAEGYIPRRSLEATLRIAS